MDKEEVDKVTALLGRNAVKHEDGFTLVEDTYKGHQGAWIVGYCDFEPFFLPRKLLMHFTTENTPALRRFFNRRDSNKHASADVRWETPDIVRRLDDLKDAFNAEKCYVRVCEKSAQNDKQIVLRRMDYGVAWDNVVNIIKELREKSEAPNVNVEVFENGRRCLGRSFPIGLRAPTSPINLLHPLYSESEIK